MEFNKTPFLLVKFIMGKEKHLSKSEKSIRLVQVEKFLPNPIAVTSTKDTWYMYCCQ